MADDQNIGTIEDRPIVEEMQESYLSYAMSVIVSRALPDVRDGLKPVQRRILYAMRQLGLGATTKHQKSAKVVGAVLGSYHPHSDTAVYDAMVRMAQDFSLRYPLVDGQGNFGSLDGDSAAAMRYTEARMSAPGDAMLINIDKETVDFVPNYDGTTREPTVLPAALPQLLLNGALGIAVGMATSIPPHNLGEVVDALVHFIDNPETTGTELMNFVKGPDFPTGGFIYNIADIRQAYATGRGPIVMRGKVEIKEAVVGRNKKKNGYQVIVSEIPYMVNKATLLEKMAYLVKTGKIEHVGDIRDESDRDGLRIVLDLKPSAFPKKVLNRLYKFTDLQKTFHVNMIALVDGVQPKLLSLRSALQEYIQHRQIVVVRRLRYELKKARDRVHILEGLNVALNHIDAVIKTIKKSKSKEDAHQALRKKYKLSERQATAILEMRLQTLAGLERKKITDELNEKKKFIKKIESILKSEKKILDVVKKELLEMRDKFSDDRRTEIVAGAVGEISEEDLVAEEETIITVTHEGYIKRVNPKTYRRQRRGGKGIIGVKTRQDDFVEHFFRASTHDDLLFFTTSGKVYAVKAYEVPEGSRTARGKAIVNFLELPQDETIAAVRALPKDSDADYLAMVTEGGMIKKTSLNQFKNIRRSGLIAMNLKKDDRLRWVQATNDGDSILLVTERGMSVHFLESDLRPMGRATQGVRGIALKKDDRVIGMTVVQGIQSVNDDKKSKKSKKEASPYFLIVTKYGYGKRTDFKEYRIQKRGGSGIKVARITEKTGTIIAARLLQPEWSDLIVSSTKGQVIRMPLKNIAVVGRVTQGVRLIRLGQDDDVAAIAAV